MKNILGMLISALVGALVGIFSGAALWAYTHHLSFFETPLLRLLVGD